MDDSEELFGFAVKSLIERTPELSPEHKAALVMRQLVHGVERPPTLEAEVEEAFAAELRKLYSFKPEIPAGRKLVLWVDQLSIYLAREGSLPPPDSGPLPQPAVDESTLFDRLIEFSGTLRVGEHDMKVHCHPKLKYQADLLLKAHGAQRIEVPYHSAREHRDALYYRVPDHWTRLYRRAKDRRNRQHRQNRKVEQSTVLQAPEK